MSEIANIIKSLAREWDQPRVANHAGVESGFLLHCEFSPPLDSTLRVRELEVPADLAEFWSHASAAELFKDGTYGQWGLSVFSPRQSMQATKRFRSQRSADWKPGDLIIGAFHGDSDQLLIRNDPASSDVGQILVVLPLDDREDWYAVADNLTIFLTRLTKEQGAKYWE